MSDDDLIEWVMMSHHIFLLRLDLPMARIASVVEAFVLPGLRRGPSPMPPRRSARAASTTMPAARAATRARAKRR